MCVVTSTHEQTQAMMVSEQLVASMQALAAQLAMAIQEVAGGGAFWRHRPWEAGRRREAPLGSRTTRRHGEHVEGWVGEAQAIGT